MKKIEELVSLLENRGRLGTDQYARLLALKALEALDELRALRWIPVDVRLPDPGKAVLAWMKYSSGPHKTATRQVAIVAMWIPKFWREFNGDDELDPDYKDEDEDDETGYWPEGWYERVECWDELSALAAWEPVTHWRELPTGPGGES